MPRFEPFPGVLYAADIDLEAVIAPPYDVIDEEQRAALEARSEYNAVHVELPRPPAGGGDPYAAAAARFEDWLAREALVAEDEPAFFVYRMGYRDEQGRLRQTAGVIGALELVPTGTGGVLPHERTMPKPKSDRLDLLRACRANLSPVWCLSLAGGLSALCELPGPPDARATDDDGVHHRLWRITQPGVVDAIRDAVAAAPVVIADGHHRYETALAYRDERRAAEPDAGDDAPWNFALALLTAADDPGLVVLPTHRLLENLERLDTDSLISLLDGPFRLESAPLPDERSDAEVAQVVQNLLDRAPDGAFVALGLEAAAATLLAPRAPDRLDALLPTDRSAAWRSLDVARLDRAVVEPLVRAGGSDREAVVRYTRDPVEAVRAVRSGAARLALFLRATPVAQVLAVAEAGDRMPEKSTYFSPKPPTGLALHALDPALLAAGPP